MYLFIRQDIPIQHQIVQTNHATFHLANILRPDCGTPNIVLIGVPDVKALERVEAKLERLQIVHYAWREPDHDFGFTALCTGPLRGPARDPFFHYRVYSPVVPTFRTSDSKSEGACENQAGGASLIMT